MRWVDTDKGFMRGSYDVRCRMVAKDFKGKDETPPLEAKRMLMSRAVTRRRDGRYRKLMFVDVKKSSFKPKV
eukprot:5763073-Karenia_brevis.AAC.1